MRRWYFLSLYEWKEALITFEADVRADYETKRDRKKALEELRELIIGPKKMFLGQNQTYRRIAAQIN